MTPWIVYRPSPIAHRGPPYRLSPAVMHRSPERTTAYKAGRARARVGRLALIQISPLSLGRPEFPWISPRSLGRPAALRYNTAPCASRRVLSLKQKLRKRDGASRSDDVDGSPRRSPTALSTPTNRSGCVCACGVAGGSSLSAARVPRAGTNAADGRPQGRFKRVCRCARLQCHGQWRPLCRQAMSDGSRHDHAATGWLTRLPVGRDLQLTIVVA